MAKYSYGLTSFIFGEISEADGSLTNPVEIINGIYKDTINTDEAEGSDTDHYVEGKKDPVVTISESGKTTIEFDFVDLSAEQKARFMGGTVTVVDLKNTWNKPDITPAINAYIKYTAKDGTVTEYPKVLVVGRRSGSVGQTAIETIKVKMTVQTPDFPALPTLIVTDPE